MFTVCPKCALTLAVTAADLRIAQGYVRCGRCLNVFNALARLSEERPAAAPAPNASAPADNAAARVSPQTASPQPEPAAPTTADDAGEIEVELDASFLVASAQAPAAPEGTADAQAQMDMPVPAELAAGASEPESAATTITETDAQPSEAAARPERDEGSGTAESVRSEEQTNTAQQNSDGAFELETHHSRAGLGWKLGAGALAIVLVLQIANHYRDALAASPALSGPVTTIYSALGVKLAPHWNLHAYDVRQLGASMAGAAAGEIVVRASVKNSGSRAQPLPLLRVTLQDRFGNRIAARDVPPGDYLPSSVASTALLAAGSRVDATMVFVDPGPQAVGFEIDACLREQSGGVRCAHGP